MSRGTPHVPSTRSARTRRWTSRKTHLFGSEAEAGFTEGEELLIVDLAGRRVAPLICFDIVSRTRPPGKPRRRRPARHRLGEHAPLLHRPRRRLGGPRSRESTTAHLREHGRRGRGLVFVGASRSVAPTGETLVEASQDREELLVVPIAELGGFDEQTDYPKLVRPPRPVKMPEGEAAALTSPAATPTTASRSRS